MSTGKLGVHSRVRPTAEATESNSSSASNSSVTTDLSTFASQRNDAGQQDIFLSDTAVPVPSQPGFVLQLVEEMHNSEHGIAKASTDDATTLPPVATEQRIPSRPDSMHEPAPSQDVLPLSQEPPRQGALSEYRDAAGQLIKSVWRLEIPHAPNTDNIPEYPEIMQQRASGWSPVLARDTTQGPDTSPSGLPPLLAVPQGGQVRESALGTGSAPNLAQRVTQGTFIASASGGLHSLVVEGTEVWRQGIALIGVEAKSAYGNFVLDNYDPATGVASYTFTLEGAAHHTGGVPVSSDLRIAATGSNGAMSSGVLTISILDDAPSAVGMIGSTVPVSGHAPMLASAADNVPVSFGADGPGSVTLAGWDENDTTVRARLGGHIDCVRSADGSTIYGYDSNGSHTAPVFTLQLDSATGHWDFSQYKHVITDDGKLDFSCVIQDADGSTASGQIDITVAAPEPPRAEAPSELALNDRDAAGSSVATGTVLNPFRGGTLSLGSANYSFDLSVQPTVTGVNQGLSWRMEGDDLIGADSHNVDVLRLSLSSGNNMGVSVTASLLEPLSHEVSSGGYAWVRNIRVLASDGINTPAVNTVSLCIGDDVPSAPPVTPFIPAMTTNVIIMLDSSSYMGGASGIAGLSRYQLAQDIAGKILAAHDGRGAINVAVFDFNEAASESVWYKGSTARADAMKFIRDGKLDSAFCNYDHTLARVEERLLSGVPAADETVAYFISGGQPTAEYDITPTAQAYWEKTLASSAIDSVQVVNVGDSANHAQLDCIAWNRNNENPVANILDAISKATFESNIGSGNRHSGNLLASGSAGADGGLHLEQINVAGRVYTFADADPSTHMLNISLDGGQSLFAVDFSTGNYTYVAGSETNVFNNLSYTLSDADGSLNSAALNLGIQSSNPVAYDNTIYVPLATTVPNVHLSLAPDVYLSAPLLPNPSETGNAALGRTTQNIWLGWLRAGDKVSFDWRTIPSPPTPGLPHDGDYLNYALLRSDSGSWAYEGNGGVGYSDILGIPKSGSTIVTIVNTGLYMLNLSLVGAIASPPPGYNYGGLEADVTNIKLTGSHLAYTGNVVTDHAGNDTPDYTGGMGASVTEVNDAYISQDSSAPFTTITGQYGYLSINFRGEYLYTPFSASSLGHDDLFCYRLSNSSNGAVYDHALLTVHVGPSTTVVADGPIDKVGTTVNDHLIGNNAINHIDGLAGNDIIFGGGGSDVLHGGAGNDTIYGNSGNSILYGDDGDDVLVCGSGAQQLYGGLGMDTFVFKQDCIPGPTSTIRDFNKMQDRIRIDSVLLGDTPDVNASADNAVVTLHSGGTEKTIVIDNVLAGLATPEQIATALHDLQIHLLANRIITEHG